MLERGVFVPKEEKKKTRISAGLPKPNTGKNKVFITHSAFYEPAGGNVDLEVRIVNNPAKLTKTDFSKVIAVIATDKKGQFNRWPEQWNTPAKIFSKVKGFYMQPLPVADMLYVMSPGVET